MGQATKVCFLSSKDESRGLLGQTLEQILNISVAATWTSLLFNQRHTVVCSVTWPLNGNKAERDLVLIQTSLPLLCKSHCFNAN